jgi:hypothetical protein
MKHGVKHTCFKCGCKFYDLNKDPIVCPKCGEDQADKPSKKGAGNVHGRGRKKRVDPEDELLDDDDLDVDIDDDEDGFQDLSHLDDGSFTDLQEIEI